MKKIILATIITAFLIIGIVSAQSYNCPMGSYNGIVSDGYGIGTMLFVWSIILFAIIALVSFIVWKIK